MAYTATAYTASLPAATEDVVWQQVAPYTLGDLAGATEQDGLLASPGFLLLYAVSDSLWRVLAQTQADVGLGAQYTVIPFADQVTGFESSTISSGAALVPPFADALAAYNTFSGQSLA